jgi:hypothetical protein
MKGRKLERGQALILLVTAIIALVGLTALAVDGSMAYNDRRKAQNASDAAALAVALQIANGTPCNTANKTALETAAATAATAVGYTDNGTTVDVAVECVSTTDVKISITSTIPTYFGKVVGVKDVTNKVTATARGGAGSTTPVPFFNGNALVATGKTGQSYLLNGSANVIVNNSGIFSNSSSAQSILINGGAVLDMDAPAQMATGGTVLMNGGATMTPSTPSAVPQIDVNDTTFAAVPAIPASPTCPSPVYSSQLAASTTSYSPGTYNGGITVNGGVTATFAPGVYCVNGAFNINGSATVSSSGRIYLVLGSQSFTVNGGVVFNFNDLEVYTTTGSFTINGSANYNPTHFRFYSTGSGNFTLNGGSTFTCPDAFFYMKSGYPTLNGSSTITLHSPPDGDPYAGLLFYMPYSTNTNSVTINGGSNISLTGTFLAPNCPITLNGSVGMKSIKSQIIGKNFIINGGTTLTLDFNADDNFGVPGSTGSVELLQ